MALPRVTDRERLAFDLEMTAEGLWSLVDRHARKTPIRGDDDPTREELADLVAALRALDAVGARLAPDLYRRAEDRRGPLDVDGHGGALVCPRCSRAMRDDAAGGRICSCGATVAAETLACAHERLDGGECADCGRRVERADFEPLAAWWARAGGDLVELDDDDDRGA